MGWAVKEPSTVYAIRCSENGKVYIGRTQNLERRLREHFRDLKKGCVSNTCGGVRGKSDLQKDFIKYGQDAFEIYVLEDGVSPADVREREAFWIAEYRSAEREFGYNLHSEKPAETYQIKRGLPPKKKEEAGVWSV